ncbi:MAG: CtrA inhibitor SciP [Alphaproteobacteria bacterium]
MTKNASDLPAPDTKRWNMHRKAQVVRAVRAGIISLEDACRQYHLSAEEFGSWQKSIEAHGLPGLRATYGKQYR